MLAHALCIVALILGIIQLAQSKLTSICAWAIICLALYHLVGMM